MDIIKAHATKNLCYIANKKMVPKGIVVHSTGANNPNLKRYVDSPENVGVNKYGNHWNQATPGGRKVCVHAFIGYDKNKVVRVAEILPLDICCWGVGAIPYDKYGNELSSAKSSKFHHYGPSYNYDPAYIQFEICEDDLTDKEYYKNAFSVAAEYCAELCKKYDIPIANIVGHIEAYKQGYGNHHSDPEHWMKRFGEDMNDFRSNVKKLLGVSDITNTKEPQKETTKEDIVSIQKGDLVAISSDAVYYSGKTMPDWVKSQHWYIKENPKGDRAVIDKNESGTSSICSPVNIKYLKVVRPADKNHKEPQKEKGLPYLVKVTASSLNIRKGAGTNYPKTGCITDKGTYTIIEESEGKGATLWGKLKSGAGWISLDYVKKI